MGRAISIRGRSVERWSPTLFIVAGVLLVGHAIVWGVRVFTDANPPSGPFAASGHFVAVVGLILLYPVLADRTPVLARGAAVAAAVPAAGWFVVTAEQLVEVAGVLPPGATALPPAFYLVVLASTVVAYVLFTVACRRAGVDSRTLGLLFLAPAVLLVTRVAARAVGSAVPPTGLVVGGGLALALLAIGFRLRTATSTDRGASAAGPAAG